MSTSRRDEDPRDISYSLKQFIDAMGGHIRTSHAIHIYKGFSDSGRPAYRSQYRERYNRDKSLPAVLYQNTKFRDEPLREYYSLKEQKQQKGIRHREYNPKLIDYLSTTPKNYHEASTTQSQISSIGLSMGRHIRRLGRGNNRALQQSNLKYTPKTIQYMIKTVDNRLYKTKNPPETNSQVEPVKQPIRSIKELCAEIKSELAIRGISASASISMDILKKCIANIVRSKNRHERCLEKRHSALSKPVEITDQLANLKDDSLHIINENTDMPSHIGNIVCSKNRHEDKGHSVLSKPVEITYQLANLKDDSPHIITENTDMSPHTGINDNHLKLVEQLLSEVRQIMYTNNNNKSEKKKIPSS